MPKKGLFLDEKNPYQKECIDILDVCGHKQGRFLGLLVHDFILRTGIDIEQLDKKKMLDYMNFLEVQYQIGYNPRIGQQPFVAPIPIVQPYYKEEKPEKKPKRKIFDDDMIRQDDMADMNNALSAFGVKMA